MARKYIKRGQHYIPNQRRIRGHGVVDKLRPTLSLWLLATLPLVGPTCKLAGAIVIFISRRIHRRLLLG